MSGPLDYTNAPWTGSNMILQIGDMMGSTWGSNMANNTGYLYWRIKLLRDLIRDPYVITERGTWLMKYGTDDSDTAGTDITYNGAGTHGTSWFCPVSGPWLVRYGTSVGAVWSNISSRAVILRRGWYWFMHGSTQDAVYDSHITGTVGHVSLWYVYGDDQPI
jgi:hypothetical protein